MKLILKKLDNKGNQNMVTIIPDKGDGVIYFVSYGVNILKVENGNIILDKNSYLKSTSTTTRYRNKVLNMSNKDVKKYSKTDFFIFENLN